MRFCIKSVSKYFSSVLIFSILLHLFLNPSAVLAQTEGSASTLTEVLPGLNRGRSYFTASEFLYPVIPGVDRRHLPLNLTFQVVEDLSIEDFKKTLGANSWKPLFHCGGKALTIDMVKKANVADGVVNQGSVEVYRFEGRGGLLMQSFYPPESNPNIRAVHDPVTTPFTNLQRSGPGVFTMTFFSAFIIEAKVVKVNETNEYLIQLEVVGHGSKNNVCPDGEVLRSLITPFPGDLIS